MIRTGQVSTNEHIKYLKDCRRICYAFFNIYGICISSKTCCKYAGYPTNDFTDVTMYDNLADFVNYILAKPTAYQYVYIGDEVKLPIQSNSNFSHYLMKGQIYHEGDTLIIGDNLVIKLVFD